MVERVPIRSIPLDFSIRRELISLSPLATYRKLYIAREQRVEFFFKYINSIDDHLRETHSKIDLIFPFESSKHRSTNLRIHISPYMRYTSTSSHKYPPTPFPQQSKQRSPLLRDPSTKGRKSLSF